VEDQTSLRQTVTHLFDAVRHGKSAQEMEEAVRRVETGQETDLALLESRTEEISRVLASMKDDPQDSLKDLAKQVGEFMATAKDQARVKLKRRASEEREKALAIASSERDKCVKSLEAYLASGPMPTPERLVKVKLVEGTYEAQASYHCDGGVKYTFGLAPQNSKFFHQEFMLSELDREVKVPVRFSRTILKGRVPSFERLDQYVLKEAEYSGGKTRVIFRRPDESAWIKVIASGFEKKDFVGLEYTDHRGSVNVMNDLSLAAHMDVDMLKSVLFELPGELEALTSNKVTLLKLSVGEEDILKTLNCYRVLESVISVLGPTYRTLLEHLPDSRPEGSSQDDLNLAFVKERLRTLGEYSMPISEVLGIKDRIPPSAPP
jgi:hypothetical protein